MSSVGYATLQIIPSMRGVQASLNQQMAGIAPDVGRQAGAKAGQGFSSGFLGGLTPMKVGAAAVGLAVAAGFRSAVNTAREFEAQLSAVAAVSGATGGELDALRDKALQLGADTAFSASESAAAMEELVKAGIPVEGVLGGAADAAVALAAAGGVELATAAEVAANAMNSFNLTAAEMPRIADLVAGAANASAIDVNDFAYSLQMSGSVAALVGLDFKDLAVGITALGNAGIKGSDAGTSLKTMLMRLEPTTAKATTLMDELGITTNGLNNQFFDAQGEAKSLAEIAGVLEEALRGQTEQQKLATLNTLFGADAIRAAAVLSKEGAAGIRELSGALGEVTAEEVAAKRLDNLNGSLEQLSGSWETLLIVIGSKAIPLIRATADGLDRMIGFLTDPPTGFFDPLIPAGRDLVAIGENVVELFGDMTSAARPFVELGAKLGAGAVVVGLTAMADVLERVTGFLADHSDVVVAATAAYVGFKGAMIAGAAWTTVSTAVSGATASVTYLTGAIQALAATRGVTTLTASVGVLRSSFEAATTGAAGLAVGIGAIAGAAAYGYMQWKKWGDEGRKMANDEILAPLREQLDGTAESYFTAASRASEGAVMLREQVVGSTAIWDADWRRSMKEGAAASEEFAQEMVASGARIEVGMSGLQAATGMSGAELQAWAGKLNVDLIPALLDGSLNFGDFVTKVRDAANAAANGTPTTDSLTGSYETLADATADSTEKLKAWKDALDAALGVEKGIFDATTDFERSLDTLEEQFGSSWVTTIDTATTAGLENREALSGAVDSAVALAAAYGETGNLEAAAMILQNTRDRLTEAGEAAGVSKEQMSAYIDELGLTPEVVQTQIDAAGLEGATGLAERLRLELDGLDGREIGVTIDVLASLGATAPPGARNAERFDRRWGGIDSYATGGIRAQVGRGDLIRWAEPETVKEAYIPFRGDRARSLAILSEAAGWFGMGVSKLGKSNRIVPMAAGGITALASSTAAAGGPAPIQFTGDIYAPDEATGEQLGLDLVRGARMAEFLHPNGVR